MRDAIAREIAVQAKLLDDARLRFGRVHPSSAFPERQISLYYVRALAAAVGANGRDGHIVLEVPIPNETGRRYDCHLDALVFGDDVAFLAEFKTAWTPKHWDLLIEDVRRIRDHHADVMKRFEQSPTKVFGFWGVDCWRAEAAECWETGTPSGRWRIPDVFRDRNMLRGSHPVWQVPGGRQPGTDFDGYYLLWAMEELSPATMPIESI